MIPQIAHFIWFNEGRDYKPSWIDENIELFKRFHPDWRVKLHDETTDWFMYIPEPLQEIVLKTKRATVRSDILRYAILKKEGGIYLDCDILTLRSFEDLRKYECFMARAYTRFSSKGFIANGVIGSIPNSPTILRILSECEIALKGKKEAIIRSFFGPVLFERIHVEEILTLLPYHYFYLFTQLEAHQFWAANEHARKVMIKVTRPFFEDRKEPYAVHLWNHFYSEVASLYKNKSLNPKVKDALKMMWLCQNCPYELVGKIDDNNNLE